MRCGSSSCSADRVGDEVRVLDQLPVGYIRAVGDPDDYQRRAWFGPSASGDLGGNALIEGGGGIRVSADGEATVLDLPEGALDSRIFDIDRRGTIVGWYHVPPRTIAALWHKDGTRTDLGEGQAFGISYRKGIVAGTDGGRPVILGQAGTHNRAAATHRRDCRQSI
jgi:hypothetical protein